MKWFYTGKHRKPRPLPVMAVVRSAESSSNTRQLRMTKKQADEIIIEALRGSG